MKSFAFEKKQNNSFNTPLFIIKCIVFVFAFTLFVFVKPTKVEAATWAKLFSPGKENTNAVEYNTKRYSYGDDFQDEYDFTTPLVVDSAVTFKFKPELGIYDLNNNYELASGMTRVTYWIYSYSSDNCNSKWGNQVYGMPKKCDLARTPYLKYTPSQSYDVSKWNEITINLDDFAGEDLILCIMFYTWGNSDTHVELDQYIRVKEKTLELEVDLDSSTCGNSSVTRKIINSKYVQFDVNLTNTMCVVDIKYGRDYPEFVSTIHKMDPTKSLDSILPRYIANSSLQYGTYRLSPIVEYYLYIEPSEVPGYSNYLVTIHIKYTSCSTCDTFSIDESSAIVDASTNTVKVFAGSSLVFNASVNSKMLNMRGYDIYNTSGEKVKYQLSGSGMGKGTYSLNLSDLAVGKYHLYVQAEDTDISSSKWWAKFDMILIIEEKPTTMELKNDANGNIVASMTDGYNYSFTYYPSFTKIEAENRNSFDFIYESVTPDDEYHTPWDCSGYYLYVVVYGFTDINGNLFAGDNIVGHIYESDLHKNGDPVYEFYLEDSSKNISKATIKGSTTGKVFSQNETIYLGKEDINISLIANAGHSTPVTKSQSVVFYSENHGELKTVNKSFSSNIPMSTMEDGRYYVCITRKSSTKRLFAICLHVDLDKRPPTISLSKTSGEVGDELTLTITDTDDIERRAIMSVPSFKILDLLDDEAGETNYDAINALTEQAMSGIVPILNYSQYYLYVLVYNPCDSRGNYIQGSIYTSSSFSLFEYKITATNVDTNNDMFQIEVNNNHGGYNVYQRDDEVGGILTMSVNDCSSGCYLSTLIKSSIKDQNKANGYVFSDVVDSKSTSNYSHFEENNGNMYFHSIFVYSSSNKQYQVFDVVVLSQVPVIKGAANKGASLTVNKGEKIENEGLSFVSYDGSPVTVTTLITLNGEKVKSVDTTKVGRYEIVYIASDAMGRNNRIVREINVLENKEVVEEIVETKELVEIEEIVAVETANTVKTNNVNNRVVNEEVKVEMEKVEMRLEEKGNFKGYSKKKEIKKNKKENFSFKLFSKYFFKVYDG